MQMHKHRKVKPNQKNTHTTENHLKGNMVTKEQDQTVQVYPKTGCMNFSWQI